MYFRFTVIIELEKSLVCGPFLSSSAEFCFVSSNNGIVVTSLVATLGNSDVRMLSNSFF